MIKFLSLLQRYRITSASILFVVVLALGWFLLLTPAQSRLAVERTNLHTQESERERLEEERRLFERLRNEMQKVDATVLEKLTRLLPKGRDVPRLIVALEALANETGILLKDVGIAGGSGSSEKQLPKGVKSIDLVVTVTGGDYPTLKRFLAAIEKNVRLLDVKSFTFAKGLQVYTINLTAYYTE